jgi:hypothetical protein
MTNPAAAGSIVGPARAFCGLGLLFLVKGLA